jgi:hypothetical protein
MFNRGFAIAAVMLPLCAFSAAPAHAEGDDQGGLGQLLSALQSLGQGGGGGDDASAAVMEGGERRPIVYENGEWGYRDHYGHWNRAPEAHRRYMEYHHPHETGLNTDHHRLDARGPEPRRAEPSIQNHANPFVTPASGHTNGANPFLNHGVTPASAHTFTTASPAHNIVTASAHPTATPVVAKKH